MPSGGGDARSSMRDSRRCHAVSAVSDKEEPRTEYGRHAVSEADEIRLAEPEATVRYRRLLRASLAPDAVNPALPEMECR
jgi:hypothetical protein